MSAAERLRAAATRLREDDTMAHPTVALEMSLLLDAASRAMHRTGEGDIPFKGHFLELAGAVLGGEQR